MLDSEVNPFAKSFKSELLLAGRMASNDVISSLLCHRNSPADKAKRVVNRLMSDALISYTGRNPDLRKTNARPRILKYHWRGLSIVPYDEFLPSKSPLVTYYPVRVNPLEEAVAVAISNRLDETTKGKSSTYVLGIFNAYFPEKKKGLDGYTQNVPSELQIIPFKNEDFARRIVEKLSLELSLDNILPTVYSSKKSYADLKVL